MTLGFWTWDSGEEADLVTTVDKCLNDLRQLLEQAKLVAEAPKAAPEEAAEQAIAAADAAEVSNGEAGEAVVTDMAGNNKRFAVVPTHTIMDLKKKVSSWKNLLPCQVKLVSGERVPADHEEVGCVGDFSFVVRDIVAEATSHLEDLAKLVRSLYNCGLRAGR